MNQKQYGRPRLNLSGFMQPAVRLGMKPYLSGSIAVVESRGRYFPASRGCWTSLALRRMASYIKVPLEFGQILTKRPLWRNAEQSLLRLHVNAKSCHCTGSSLEPVWWRNLAPHSCYMVLRCGLDCAARASPVRQDVPPVTLTTIYHFSNFSLGAHS